MRSIVFDELNKEEINNIRTYLNDKLLPGAIAGLYWLILPDYLLTKTQMKLQNTEGPFKIAVDLQNSCVRFELLVRSDEITNLGSEYANEKQTMHIYDFASKMAKELDLLTCL
ncbi:MAG: hypothetical protein LBQ79_06185 [Deltaproteobacteria bacterium]|jgi:hypothetical protein|nr:hypothetical protein [Deltaproteobacteria bacterium]